MTQIWLGLILTNPEDQNVEKNRKNQQNKQPQKKHKHPSPPQKKTCFPD